MNFNRKQLTNAVKAVSKALDNKAKMPLMRCVVVAHDSVLGTDLDTWIRVELDGSCTGNCPGNYRPLAVDSKQLLAILTSSKDELVVINSLSELLAQVDGQRIDLRGAPGDYPRTPTIDYNDAKYVTISGKQLDSVINQTAWAAATYDSSILDGVSFDGSTVVSSDGCRLSCVNNVPFAGTGVSTLSAIVNARVLSKVIQPLVKLTAKENRSVTMIQSEDKKTMSFSATEWTVITRLIDSAYPRYQELFPVTSLGSTISFNRIETLTALAKWKPFLKKQTNLVDVDATGNKISMEDHEAIINMHLSDDLKEQQVGWSCNYDFLVEALKSFVDAYVCVQYNGPLKPLIFNPGGDYRHLLMPIEKAKAKAA